VYAKSAEDLEFKVQSINFKQVASHSELIPVTMDTLSEARKQFQQDMRAKGKANTAKAVLQPGTLMTAQIDRSKIPKHFAAKPTTLIKEEQVASSIMLTGTVTTSNVSFVGPRNDPGARRNRACEFDVKLLVTSNQNILDRYMYEKVSQRSECRRYFLSS